MNEKAKRRARRLAKRGPRRRQRPVAQGYAGVVSVDQDTGDDCPVCLFIRARAGRADERGLILLTFDEVAQLAALMRG